MRAPRSFPQPHSFSLRVLLLLFLSPCLTTVHGALSNATIDDTDSAWAWTGDWTAVTPANPCNGCSSKPDVSQVQGGTYHDGNYMTGKAQRTGGSFSFTGSAVYIYGIDQADSMPDVVFTLDSSSSHSSTHHYTGSERFVYHSLFFSASGLSSGQHTVSWTFDTDPTTGQDLQAALFDYALVTRGEVDVVSKSKSTSQKSSTTTTTTTKSSATVSLPGSSTISSSISSTQRSGTLVGDNQSQSTSLATSNSSGADTSQSPTSASTASHSHTGPIVGAVLAVLAVLALIAAFLLCIRRRRQRQRARASMLVARPGGQLQSQSGTRVRRTLMVHPFVEEGASASAEGYLFSEKEMPKAHEAGYTRTRPPASLSTTHLLPKPGQAMSPSTSASPSTSTSHSLSPHPFRSAHSSPSPSPSPIPIPLLISTSTPHTTLPHPLPHTTPTSRTPLSASAAPTQTLSPTQRERLLEERLAELEARLAEGDEAEAPPPYVHANANINGNVG